MIFKVSLFSIFILFSLVGEGGAKKHSLNGDGFDIDCASEFPEGFVPREGNKNSYFRSDSEKGLQTITFSSSPFNEEIFLEEDVEEIKELRFGKFYIYHYALIIGGEEGESFGRERFHFIAALSKQGRIDFSNMDIDLAKDILSRCDL